LYGRKTWKEGRKKFGIISSTKAKANVKPYLRISKM
jgi:hypothetical protein